MLKTNAASDMPWLKASSLPLLLPTCLHVLNLLPGKVEICQVTECMFRLGFETVLEFKMFGTRIISLSI